ncbi:MAG TPA: DegT/DnrJ/EryC1/StrS family aminotransferase [Chloroflexia bacterium]|nr:DegT/DnrJ/EryC1/StrS family aminotransferase [Chloroflexia bacterium]
MRTQFLPFALPDLDDSEMLNIKQVLESGWITTGPRTRQFEAEFARYVGARHAIAVNSCTAAMHLALEAIGLEAGDEVITTPYTFAATAEVVRYFGARPVFVDVDPHTLNIRPDLIEGAVTPQTRAIMPVHIAGLPTDMDAVSEVARAYNLPVIEDAAHAFPAWYRGRMVGSLSDFTCFSFYATKTITTAEGGMVCTDNDAWAERCRIMALHGISQDAWKRYSAEGTWYYEVVAPGFKYNMTDIAAAMGQAQLAKAERMLERRREIAWRYNAAFSELPELQLPPDSGESRHAWHLYLLRLNLDMLRIDRAEFVQALKNRNIGASVHFIPLHLHPYYRDLYGYHPEDYPAAFAEYLRVLSLPVYSKMSDRDVDDVISAVQEVVRSYSAVSLPPLDTVLSRRNGRPPL